MTPETVKDFCARIGIRVQSFSRSVRRSDCPDFVSYEGPTGRIIRLEASDALEGYLSAENRYLRRSHKRDLTCNGVCVT